MVYIDWILSRVDRTQAQLLPNATLRIPGDEDHHVIALSVFHQMHCLVSLSVLPRCRY